jgi:hypothetical protein
MYIYICCSCINNAITVASTKPSMSIANMMMSQFANRQTSSSVEALSDNEDDNNDNNGAHRRSVDVDARQVHFEYYCLYIYD